MTQPSDPTLVKPDAVFQKAAELLKNNRGIFIGETHGETLAWGFLVKHAEDFKKLGVTPLYMELDMYSVAARQAGVECREAYSKANAIPSEMTTFDTQLMLAKMAGLRIIGHDDITDKARFTSTSLGTLAVTGKAVDRRDDFAKKIIEQTADGAKFIIYGGSWHSGNEVKSSRPSGKGLDEKLGIPSIDFHTVLTPVEGTWNTIKKTAEIFWNGFVNKDSIRVKLEDGKGAATYNVTAENPLAFVPSAKLDGMSEREEALKKTAEDAQKSGACGFQPLLQGKDILNDDDINGLVNRLKKPGAKPSTIYSL